MRKINLLGFLLAIIVLSASCNKDDDNPPAEEYLVVGKINTSKTNIAGTITASFNVKYNSPNAFNEPAGSINGTLTWTGLPSTADSVAVYAYTTNELNYLVATSANAISKVHTFTNGTTGSLALSLPLTAEAAAPFTKGLGYMRIGKSGNYIFVSLDGVTKIK